LDFGGAVDIKTCPHSCHLLACVLDKDLWLMNADSGEKTRLTFSHTPNTDLYQLVNHHLYPRCVCACYWGLYVGDALS